MDEGSKSASELTAATLLKSIRDVLFLSIWRPYFIIQREKKGQAPTLSFYSSLNKKFSNLILHFKMKIRFDDFCANSMRSQLLFEDQETWDSTPIRLWLFGTN